MCTGPSSVRTLANASSTAARSLTSAATPSAVTPSRAQFLGNPLRRFAVEVEHGDLVSTPAQLVAGRFTHAGAPPVTTATRVIRVVPSLISSLLIDHWTVGWSAETDR